MCSSGIIILSMRKLIEVSDLFSAAGYEVSGTENDAFLGTGTIIMNESYYVF